MRTPDLLRYAALPTLLLLMALHGDGVTARAAQRSRMSSLPRITVWAWERREDLRALDPATTAVAYLDRTVRIGGEGVTVVPRRQPMLLPATAALVRIPVVRVETEPGAVLDDARARQTAEAIVAAAHEGESSSRALQIDFDALRSERGWYAEVLREVRHRLPAGMPLSITALASWCSYDGGWLRGLPIDEAVPMLFRMEPDRRQFAPNGGRSSSLESTSREFAIREPVCTGAVGISTREAWPRELAGRRVYLFADRGWQRDGLNETVKELE